MATTTDNNCFTVHLTQNLYSDINCKSFIINPITKLESIVQQSCRFKKYFPHMPKTFPCTSKVIFVFQQVKQSSEQTTCKTKNNKNNPSDLAADQDTNSSACTTNDKTNNSKNSDSNNNNIKVDDDENDNNEKLDVCFFGMHVQEYGCEVEAPNCR